jgi:glycosyltransferase involved in cell wall biosynthesis
LLIILYNKNLRANLELKQSAASERRQRVLFVAPFAHYDGHHCYVALSESQALARAGLDVLLLTFNGFIDESTIKPNIRATSLVSIKRRKLINGINANRFAKWPFMFFTSLVTLMAAAMIYSRRHFDIIHLRDADPFPFLPRLVGLVKGHTRWAVSVLSTLDRVPQLMPISRLPVWNRVYSASLENDNKYLYLTQNRFVMEYYSDDFLHGILSGSVYELPPMIPKEDIAQPKVDQAEARKHFRLPTNKTVFLSFGSVHPGKAPEVIFEAIQDIPGAICLHAGKTTLNMQSKFEKLKKQYGKTVLINDVYVSEKEKPYYFAVSDAVMLSYTHDFKATASMLWEACRYQKPVIASDSGQLGELVRKFDLGFTFKSEDPKSLKEAMEKFVAISELRVKEIERNCSSFCDEFSSENWVAHCVELYQKLR